MGTLREFGKLIAFKSINETKDDYLRKKDSLENNKGVYIILKTAVDASFYEYRFTLICPSLLISEKDTRFNENTFGEELAKAVAISLAKEGFTMGDNAFNGSETPPMLLIKEDGETRFLQQENSTKFISLDGYKLLNYRLTFFCTKAFYEQIKNIDFKPIFNRGGLAETEIKALLREKIGAHYDKNTVEAVFETMFSSNFEIGERIEQKYELRYFQLMK